MDFLSWTAAHWFELLQSAGIICGLLFTGFALRADKKVIGVQTLFTITEHHRDLWTQLYSRPDLSRLLLEQPDLKSRQITTDEERFINLLILHLFAVYRASLAGIYVTPENLRNEIGSFFILPIPQFVWNKIRSTQDSDFVSFVEKGIREFKATQSAGVK